MVALLQVQCLEEVVRTRSFRSAAHALHMSQPSVSGHIARLERELHLTLLDRGPSGSDLTPDGRRILPHLRAFVESADLIRRVSEVIQSNAQQTLTVVGETRRLHAMLPDTIAMLKATFENVTVRVEACSGDEICSALRSGHADVGVMAVESSAVAPDDIVTSTVMDLGPTGVCAPFGCETLRTRPGPIDARHLQGASLIICEDRAIELTDRFFPVGRRPAVSVVDDVAVGLQLVERGMGIMLMSSIGSYVVNPRVDWRALVDGPDHSVRLSHLAGETLSAPAQAFVRHLTEWGASCSTAFHYNPVTGQLEVDDEVRRWNGTLAS